MSSAPRVGGRFAPTPSGPLHLGSLIAAVASRADALAAGGVWQVRIDDIDPPRERPGAREGILRTLERYGLASDAPILLQSARRERYADALARLAADGRLYRCRCTRRTLAGLARYPGTCRARRVAAQDVPPLLERPLATPGDALRLHVDGAVRVDDLVQGSLELEPGDPVLRRRDGLVAYPLASAVDDADVARVVRGADLLEASAAQIAVLERLGAEPPEWAHVPLAVDAGGRKLGKSTGAPPIDALEPLATLRRVWRFLGQAPIDALDVDAFWREAIAAWSLARVPPRRECPAPTPRP